MQALIMKAADIKSITPSRKKSLFVQMSRAGLTKDEPGFIPQEQPSMFFDLFNLHLEDLEYTKESLAKALGVSLQKDLHEWGVATPGLRVVS